MHRKFITNLGLLLFLNLLVKPFWIFGIDRTVQNLVATSEYGFYSVILNLTFTLNILLDFGITNFNNKNIAQNNHLLNKHFSGIIILKMILGAVFLLTMVISGLLLHFDERQFYFLGFLALNQFLVSFILYLRSNISGLLHFKTDSLISVLDRLLMILFCGMLIWGGVTDRPFEIIWFVYAQTLAYFITALIAFLVVVNYASFSKLRWNPAFFRLIIRQSYPFAILVLLMTFYNRFDSVMIAKLLGEERGNEQVGIYASAFRLLDAVNMIAYLFSVILLPIFAKLIKEKSSVESLVRVAFTLLFTCSVIFSVGASFYSADIMKLLYVKHIAESSAVFTYLILGFIPIATTYVFGTLLTANGSLKYLNIIALSGMVINIVLNLFLIPRFYAVGSAYASLITQVLTAVLQILIAQRLFRFTVNKRYLFTLAMFALGVILVNMLCRSLPLDWKAGFILMGGLSLLLAFGLRLLRPEAMVALLKRAE